MLSGIGRGTLVPLGVILIELAHFTEVVVVILAKPEAFWTLDKNLVLFRPARTSCVGVSVGEKQNSTIG